MYIYIDYHEQKAMLNYISSLRFKTNNKHILSENFQKLIVYLILFFFRVPMESPCFFDWNSNEPT